MRKGMPVARRDSLRKGSPYADGFVDDGQLESHESYKG